MRIFIACVALLGIFVTTAFGAAGGRECTNDHKIKDTSTICFCSECPENKSISKKEFRWLECEDSKQTGVCYNNQTVMILQINYYQALGPNNPCGPLLRKDIHVTNGCSGESLPKNLENISVIDKTDPRRDP